MDAPDLRVRVFDELAVVGKAFGSAKRLALVELLAQGERTVESLARTADMGVSTASAHLQVLKMANLVSTRREGTKIHYRLAGDDVLSLYDAMRTVARSRSADVAAALDSYLGLPGSDEVGLVTAEELHQLLAEGRVTLLDVRPAEEYHAGHLPGATSAPLESLVGRAAEFEAAGEIVAYCRGAFCVMAHDAVRLLAAEGVPARRLDGGMLEWRSHGERVEVSNA